MFIKIEDNYNPLTLQGSDHRLINVNHILHIIDLSKRKDDDKVRVRVESRICLTNGEIIDTVHSVEEIERRIMK
ncbi:hypothetical protein SAMN04488104_1002181 [Algoriphagus faecimaris]|uniref:Uncharacterized protein n=1 Tax=Algoriphagus faecimaris TaxID=686796 RepID=A0A1G6N188_9BACT|nr:hypothetical protein SAMN04488104_1002181 [Algoriphagus faecimaris]